MTEMPPITGSDGHAGDLVSAYLDGELDEATATWVLAHLEVCAGCRRSADEAREARQWVRSLPAVDAGPVVEGFLARHRAIVRTGTAFVGLAAVALGALALTSAALRPDVVPDVDAVVRAHLAATGATTSAGADAGGRMHEVAGVHAAERVEGHYAVPATVFGDGFELPRRAMYGGRDLTVAVYGDGPSSVSVFQQPGALEWESLPRGAIEVVGRRTVWVRDGSPAVMVTEVGDLVVTAVSDDRTALTTVVEGLPRKERSSTWARLHDACLRFTRTFSGS